MTDTLNKLIPDGDPVFLDIIKRTMIESYIGHARKKGASEEWLEKVRAINDSFMIVSVIEICYGRPGEEV